MKNVRLNYNEKGEKGGVEIFNIARDDYGLSRRAA